MAQPVQGVLQSPSLEVFKDGARAALRDGAAPTAARSRPTAPNPSTAHGRQRARAPPSRGAALQSRGASRCPLPSGRPRGAGRAAGMAAAGGSPAAPPPPRSTRRG